MAANRMWAVKNRLDHLVNYVSNPYKTIGLETVIDYIDTQKRLLKKDMSLILTVYLIIQN